MGPKKLELSDPLHTTMPIAPWGANLNPNTQIPWERLLSLASTGSPDLSATLGAAIPVSQMGKLETLAKSWLQKRLAWRPA